MYIDIFVPYWGDPVWLRETVASVLAQDCGDWRLTVLDDAYPDEWAGAWLQNLNDSRISYIRNERNLGIVNNYRKCLRESSGDWVVLLGCDDILLPNYVRVLLEAVQKFPDAAIIQPGARVIDERGLIVFPLADRIKKWWCAPKSKDYVLLGGDPLAASLLLGNWLYWPSLCFQKSRINAFDFQDDLKLTHDLAIVLDMVFSGQKLLYVPEVCFSYRRHLSSASNASLLDGRRFAEEKRCFERARLQASLLSWRESERAARWHFTSRLNSLFNACKVLVLGRPKMVPRLIAHAFSFRRY